MTTLLEASSRYLKATTHVVRVDIHPEDYREAMSAMDDEIKAARAALEQAIAQEQSMSPKLVSGTPVRRCSECVHFVKHLTNEPCKSCTVVSFKNWEPKP